LLRAFEGREGFAQVAAIEPDGPTGTHTVAANNVASVAEFIDSANGKRNYTTPNTIEGPKDKATHASQHAKRKRPPVRAN